VGQYPQTVWLEYWRKHAVSRARATDAPGLARQLRRRYRSLSLHKLPGLAIAIHGMMSLAG
jgi:hypothetical protein